MSLVQANDKPLFTEEEILRVRRRLAKLEKVRNKQHLFVSQDADH